MIIKNLLSKEQQDFLKKYKISEELLMDASAEELSADLIQSMSELNKVLAYNTVPCVVDANHTFKTIGNYCPQCDPTKIAPALRENKIGYMYIAGSRKSQLIKVGSSNETKDRIKTVNFTSAKCGGFDDWELLYYAKTPTLGKAERLFQQDLSEYKASYEHEKAGKLQNGGDLYRCSYNKAKDALVALQTEGKVEFSQINERRHLTSDYQFKNLRVKSELVEA